MTRCSDLAAGDAREGTAPPGERWFLVEHPGPWGRVAFAQSGLDPAVVTALDAWARTARGRVLLIRRPGRRSAGGPRRWFRVDSRPGHESVRTGTVTDDAGLVDALSAPGTAHPEPLYLACVHGRHDTCCAVRGRPLAAALAAVEPDRTWECSHVGGCRFAPALVLLPHGFVLGGTSPAQGVAAAAGYADGVVDPAFLRGRSTDPPAVQAAQHHARLVTGARGVDALRVVAVDAPGTGRWRVRMAGPDVEVELTERRVDPGRPLTCAATAPGWMREFDVLALRS
ncbi:sucrase ferredoxin [Pseudonocardia hydrocarbonoxydans]|uniref:Sucrase ferredoxin n=1 Tax=Pseudonocardia hydrocarbonoxydans TaxID=76726 RepID=A0A4Y3WLQ1_9PSEU|nr:sucrase ferredoxin [Pseudonocardia hydrocarbonoxydans]GEC18970.1 sucrase ferredoxin [Pseudonocardia hydrocarbonoxydans]